MRHFLLSAAFSFFAFSVFTAIPSFGAESCTCINETWSPDSTMIAFTRANDLYIKNVASGLETRLTFDGTDLILNGYASWVYYEEIFGRASNYRAFWWSPDSRKIAFYRFDDSNVPIFPIYSPFVGQGGHLTLTRYPMVGQTNPSVKVGILDLDGRNVVWADFNYSADQYFGTPFWGRDSKELYVSIEPRRQNVLDLFAISVVDGSKRAVYHEEYPTWVEWIDGIIFTDEGLFMSRNFETGWEQLYFLGYDGKLVRLTEGENWDIRLLKVDENQGDIWFTARRDSRLHPSLYRLDRRGKVFSLTDPSFWVKDVSISDDLKSFTALLSNSSTPWFKVEGDPAACSPEGVHRVTSIADAIVLKTASGSTCISSGVDVKQVSFHGPQPEIVSIENEGFHLYGLMSKPRNFAPGMKYPVIMQLYGGPGTPYVRDRWADRDASDRWAWENGIIYIVVDPRSSGENGRRGMDQSFGRMTVIELEDYIAWARWLGSLPYVDASRIGVEGFSFGGTTTAMLVLRYPEYFHCGVAGGGVYDWTLYDSHYTERFMDTPLANPDGYACASVISFVESSKVNHGFLKLTHGTGDDNVHFQNTLLLVDALQRQNIQFELMIYPDGMHGYRGAQHIHDLSSNHIFWNKHLLN